jgi:hypothetical protein
MASSAGNEKTSKKDSPSWTECARRRPTVIGHGVSAQVMQYAICLINRFSTRRIHAAPSRKRTVATSESEPSGGNAITPANRRDNT